MCDKPGWMISRRHASYRASRDGVDRDAARQRGILSDGDIPPATPLPSNIRRAGGFASLPYDSFAERTSFLYCAQARSRAVDTDHYPQQVLTPRSPVSKPLGCPNATPGWKTCAAVDYKSPCGTAKRGDRCPTRSARHRPGAASDRCARRDRDRASR